MSLIIDVRDLTKVYRIPIRQPGTAAAVMSMIRPEYKSVTAVDSISFSLRPGEIVGYIGPNGAGKSTTIKMLTGILVPTSGQVIVDGLVPFRRRRENAQQIGVVFGQRTQLWWDLPVRESFYLLKNLYRIATSTYRDNILLFNDLLALDEIWDVPVRLLSLGQRMRADLAAAVVHSPRLLFLDEPTIGLDVVAKERIRQFLRGINELRETTVILTTHDLRDIEETCSRVIMIHRGRLTFDGSLQEVKKLFGDRSVLRVEVSADGARWPLDLPPSLRLIRREDSHAWFDFSRDEITAADAIKILCSLLPVKDVALQEADLESVVKRVYGGHDV